MAARASEPPVCARAESVSDGVRAKHLRPFTRTRSEVRARGDRRAAALLDAFMGKRRMSNVELGEVLEVGEAVVRRIRANDNAALHVGDVLEMPRKHARAFVYEMLEAIEEGQRG